VLLLNKEAKEYLAEAIKESKKQKGVSSVNSVCLCRFGCLIRNDVLEDALLECILLLVINSKVSCISMEKTNHVKSCDSRVHAYKNGKTMEQCKEEARENTLLLSKELLENGEVLWARILDTAGHDELVYNFEISLKYLQHNAWYLKSVLNSQRAIHYLTGAKLSSP
jgi:hypothetical protein